MIEKKQYRTWTLLLAIVVAQALGLCLLWLAWKSERSRAQQLAAKIEERIAIATQAQEQATITTRQLTQENRQLQETLRRTSDHRDKLKLLVQLYHDQVASERHLKQK